VNILNPQGENCFSRLLKIGEKIDISNFPSGTYIFQIESKEEGSISRKIVRI